MQVNRMDNEALKQVFRSLLKKITKEVNPDSIIDDLYSKTVISDDDYRELRQAERGADRCRELFSVLRGSSHPETFIQLREALLDEYPQIVDEIDKHLTLQPTRQTQKPRMSQSTEGKLMRDTLRCQSFLLTESCFTSSHVKLI